MSVELITILMLVGLLFGVMLGYPLAIPIGAVALIGGYLLFGESVFSIIYDRTWGLIRGYTFLAVPLFIFMGVMLERSGIAEKMYSALYLVLGGLRGGLAVATILIGTILAACVGIIGASVTMLALLALPSMINRGYSRSLASGTVCASGCLGILIPPSIMLVVYGPMANISVGQLFMGAIPPGLLLSILYIGYVVVRCALQPSQAPAVSAEERAIPASVKMRMLLTSLFPPLILIFAVLGTIFLGIAPPTEAAAIGAFVTTILTIFYKKFSFKMLYDTALHTLRVGSMILLIGAMALSFSAVFLRAGCGQVVENVILAVPGGRWGSFAAIMVMLFLLGYAVDWKGIVFIMVPIMTPIAETLGFDPVWFAIMVCVNLQMSFMTPPFAPAMFYLKASADPVLGIQMGHIIRGVIPFVSAVVLALLLCIVFPQIILWLPSMMLR